MKGGDKVLWGQRGSLRTDGGLVISKGPRRQIRARLAAEGGRRDQPDSTLGGEMEMLTVQHGRVSDRSGEHSSGSPLCSTSPQRTPLQPVPAIPSPQQQPLPHHTPAVPWDPPLYSCTSPLQSTHHHQPFQGTSAATAPPRGTIASRSRISLSLATADTGPGREPPPLSPPLSRETTMPHRRVPLQGNHITQRPPRPGQQFPPRGHHQHSFSDSNSLSDGATASASPLQGSHGPQPVQHSSCSCRAPLRLPASHCPPCRLQNSRQGVRPGTGSAPRLPCS